MEHAGNTSTKCVNLSEGGAAIGWIICVIRAIKNDSSKMILRRLHSSVQALGDEIEDSYQRRD
jgi:hypothetical protein